MARLPHVTLALGALLLCCSLLSLFQVLSPETILLLSLRAERVAAGEAWYGLLSFWLFVTKPFSLLLVLLPLFLFGPLLEKHLGGWRALALFLAGVGVGGVVFVLTFASSGGVVTGALPGGVALAGAALVLSFLGRAPTPPGALPTWALGLAFLGGVAWVSYLNTPEAPLRAVAFGISPAPAGMLLTLLFIRRLAPPAKDG